MIEPTLVAPNALADINVGLSVSDSADLARLGLDPRHAELAVGELTRAVLLAGGTVVYGGRIKPSGFTQQLMAEVRRYGTSRHSLTICLALPEHLKLTNAELDKVDRELGAWGRLITLDGDGSPVPWSSDPADDDGELEPDKRGAAYSGLRRFVTDSTDARVLVGGQLRGYQGAMPGIIEEAILSIEREQPLYAAGGFGGASALVAQALGAPMEWLPPDAPQGREAPGVEEAIARLANVISRSGWSPDRDGFSTIERALFAATHRPADIASLAVLGMARRFADRRPDGTDREV